MTEQTSTPSQKANKGVIALVHWPDGDVVASVADFDRTGYGGCSLFDAQRMRARQAVKRSAITKMCHPDIGACLDEYALDSLFTTLVQRKGYSLTVVPVGYPDEKTERDKK